MALNPKLKNESPEHGSAECRREDSTLVCMVQKTDFGDNFFHVHVTSFDGRDTVTS